MFKQHLKSAALVALTSLVPACAAHAELHSKAGRVVVLEPQDLPEAAHLASNSFFLHANGKDGYYLYVEQQNGAQLSIFDVSDPAHIKLQSTHRLAVSGAFDFVRPLGERAELMRFRDGQKVAVLDLSKENEPEVHDDPSLQATGQAVVLDRSQNTEPSSPADVAPAAPHDYEVIDASSSSTPEHVTTIKGVEHELTNRDTGTTFLLSPAGLTVVRRTDTEQSNNTHQQQLSNQ